MDFFSVSFCLLYFALFSVKRFPTPLKTDFPSTLTSTGAITYQTSSLILETLQISCYRVLGAVRSGGNDKRLVITSLLYFTTLNSTPTLSLALDHCSSNVTKQMEQVLIVTIITSSTIIIFSTSLLHNLLSTCSMCTYNPEKI